MPEVSLRAFDDCVKTIWNADCNFYQNALGSWFSVLNQEPAFERELLRLKSLVDFEAWHDGLQTVVSGGRGVQFPADLDKALGLQLSLFDAMARNKINASQFAHAYVASKRSPKSDLRVLTEKVLKSDLRVLTEKVFMPMSRRLRRRLETLNGHAQPHRSMVTNSMATNVELAPAADRIVSTDRDSREYDDLIVTLNNLRDAFRVELSNSAGDRERETAQLESASGALKPGTMEESEKGNLRDSEIALMDAIKTILELLLTVGAAPAQIDKLLGSSQQKYRGQLMPRAVAVMDTLRKFVNDPSRSGRRQEVRRIPDEPAAGSGTRSL